MFRLYYTCHNCYSCDFRVWKIAVKELSTSALSGHIFIRLHNLNCMVLPNFCGWVISQMLFQTCTWAICELNYKLSCLWCCGGGGGDGDRCQKFWVKKNYSDERDEAVGDTDWCWQHVFTGTYRTGTARQEFCLHIVAACCLTPYTQSVFAQQECELFTCTQGHKGWDATDTQTDVATAEHPEIIWNSPQKVPRTQAAGKL